MRSRSSRKRNRAARPVSVGLALLFVGALYAAVAPSTQVAADTGTSAQVKEGKALFQVTCSSCHGLNGEGTSQGPSLVGVGAASVDFQMSTNRMPMARPEQQAPQRMISEYTADEIAAIASYVDTLGPGPAIPNSSQYDYSQLTEEDIARGGELFRTNCSACHQASGVGGALPNGKYAPNLSQTEPIHIWEAMRTGPQQMPVFAEGALPDEDVAAIIGYLAGLSDEPTLGLTLGGFGPVSEGLFVWIIGIGGLSLVAVWIASRGALKK
ncbi:MAG: c-type cytochrome [Propioniciclava sp.]